MISEPTVLILGAGSSTHCGYPLGSQLVANICQERNRPSFDEIPFDQSDVEAFITRLSRSAYYSIDAFLADTGEHLDIGKFLIAHELSRVEDLDRLFPPNKSGWYQYLFNQMLVNGKPDFEKNNLSIVTFNYDRSLEAYLHTVTMNRFRMSSSEATERLASIPIIHPHGILGEYPDKPYAKPKGSRDLSERASGIKVIHELSDESNAFCSGAFKVAYPHLTNAKRVYFLGFGFHTDNLKRFRFFTKGNLAGKQLKETTYGMGHLEFAALERRLDSFGFPKRGIPLNHNLDCNRFFSYAALLE